MLVEVSGVDVNDVDADVVAIPIDARLTGERRVVQAVLGACAPALRNSLARLAAAIPTGIAPGAVVVMPAEGHRRFKVILFVVLFDNREPDATAAVVEPDEARIELAAAALWKTLEEHHDGSLALVPFAGRLGDTGEAAASVTRVFASLSVATNTRRVIFVERDPILRRDIRTSLESIGIPVGGPAEINVVDDDNGPSA
ncbi:MAG: hypothetical protein Q8O67_21265 [Deltaproteobacteria bacterium]|nr:hypothetical protein [Deltaproteobacteria bacterium]